MKESPWLNVPLADYEAHMSSSGVGQAQMLADLLADAIGKHKPRTLAVFGCAGGNGFDRIPASVERIVGVDVNPDYAEAARARFATRLRGLEIYVGDVSTKVCRFEPVELAFVGLLFEYVNVASAFDTVVEHLQLGGVLVTVLQAPGSVSAVTPSLYGSLLALETTFQFVAPETISALAGTRGLESKTMTTVIASGGKRFAVLTICRPKTKPCDRLQ
jgi:hypothetical protein